MSIGALASRQAELAKLFTADEFLARISLPGAAVLEVMDILNGIHLLSQPGLGSQTPETSAFDQLAGRMMVLDASLQLGPADADMISLIMLHGLQATKRDKLYSILNGTSTPIAGSPAGLLSVTNQQGLAESTTAETDYAHLELTQGVEVLPSERLDHSVHMRAADSMGRGGTCNTHFDLSKLKPQSARRAGKKEIAQGFFTEVEEEPVSRLQYISTSNIIMMLFTCLASILGREVSPSKYPGTGGSLLVQASDGSGNRMRVTVRHTIVMAFCNRIVTATGHYPTAMAQFILERALIHLTNTLHRSNLHPEEVWTELTHNGTHCFEPKQEHIDAMNNAKKPPAGGGGVSPLKGVSTGTGGAIRGTRTKGCNNFARDGACRFGANCRFSHDPKLVAEAKKQLGNTQVKRGPQPPPGPPPMQHWQPPPFSPQPYQGNAGYYGWRGY